jgi:hypothetical protein
MVPYTSQIMLEDHGNRFVAVTYFLSKDVVGRPFDADRVFGELGMGGFDDNPQQARAELVQFLERQQPPRIKYDESHNTVSLTDAGLQWGKEDGDKPPYLEYRHLRN